VRLGVAEAQSARLNRGYCTALPACERSGEHALIEPTRVGCAIVKFANHICRNFTVTVVAHPAPGTIVRVDLSEGFRVPEIGKRRPAVILSPPIPGRKQLCTIVPLSTTDPRPVCGHHLRLKFDPVLPEPYDSPEMWLKGDIVLTVAFHRLRLLFSGWNSGQREYDVRVLSPEDLEKVRNCVRTGLGL
jgi:mRNA interferase MazF